MGNDGLMQRMGGRAVVPFGDGPAERLQPTGMATNNAAVAVAERARAMVQARALVAMHRPRDVDDARLRMLKECSRPGFAKGARYSVPRGGKKITGPSIRFAEAALRAWGNVEVQAETTYEDDERRIVRVSVIDLETNASYSTELSIAKTVERKEIREGHEVVGSRVNSQGIVTYLVLASDDEMTVKQAALVSKAIRTTGLRLIPGDIIDECMDRCGATLNGGADDSDQARKRMIAAFAEVAVTPKMLAEYLGHPADVVSRAEMADLFPIYEAIRDRATTWRDVMEQRRGKKDASIDEPAPADDDLPEPEWNEGA